MAADAEVDAHNRRTLWQDVANHLRVAHEAIEQAQSALEDLGEPSYADLLQPFVDELRRARANADEVAVQ